MPNYQNGKIYKLVSDKTDRIYIGSTVEKYLTSRLSKHKHDYRGWKNGCSKVHFITSFLLFEDDANVSIELVEVYPCTSIYELRKREGEIIKENRECCVNGCVAGRTHQEYYRDNIGDFTQKSKLYRESHKTEISRMNREYRHKNADEVRRNDKLKYYKNHEENKKRRNELYYKNHEENKAKAREKYNANVNGIKDRLRETIRCDICNCEFRKSGINRHMKTQKHLDNISSNGCKRTYGI